MSEFDVHKLLGAYVLGGLAEEDRQRFQQHLPACAECAGELARSAPLPGLLRRAAASPTVGRAQVPAVAGGGGGDQASLAKLLEEVGNRRARRGWRGGRWRWLILAAALAVVAGLGMLPLLSQRSDESHESTSFTASAGSKVVGHARLATKPWGTAVSVEVTHLPAAGSFVLRVSGPDGRQEQAAAWGAVPHAGTVKVAGASSLRPGDIRALSIVDQAGHTLAVSRPS